MNKLLKLILVNLLDLVDFNGVVKEIESGVKGKSEIRLIIISLVSIAYGGILYFLFSKLGDILINKNLLFFVGFILSTIVCFVVSFMQVDSVIFKSDDTEYLFSLPLTKHQIIFSKLFNVYIKNMFFVLIIMLSCILAFANYGKVTEMLGLMYIVESMLIPFLPIILSVLICYMNYYIKLNKNKIECFIIKIFTFLILGFVFFFIIKGINVSNINTFMHGLYERLVYVYPTNFLYFKSLIDGNVLCLIIYIIINVIVIYFYMYFLLKSYNKICTLLKGVKKKSKFDYGSRISLRRGFGFLRKELLCIFKNKLYYGSSFSLVILLSLILIVGGFFIPIEHIIKMDNFYYYYNLIGPFALATMVCLGNSAINSISLEKYNIDNLLSLPIKFNKVLFYKWFTNVYISSFIIIIDGTFINLLLKPNTFVIVCNYLVPLFAVMFISLISIILDYKFVVKRETDDGVILRQRFITLVPSLISICIIFIPFVFKVYKLYKNILMCFIVVSILIMIFSLIYLFVNKNKLRKNLTS